LRPWKKFTNDIITTLSLYSTLTGTGFSFRKKTLWTQKSATSTLLYHNSERAKAWKKHVLLVELLAEIMATAVTASALVSLYADRHQITFMLQQYQSPATGQDDSF